MNFFLLHPGLTSLVEFDAGELPAIKHARVASHIRSCVKCQGTLRFVRRVGSTSASIPTPNAPAALLDKILANRAAGERVLIPGTAPLESRTRKEFRHMRASIAAAASIAIVLTLAVNPKVSAASGQFMHDLVHRVGGLRSWVDSEHSDSIDAARRSAAIPVYAPGAVTAETPEEFGAIATVKAFSDGRVLVHDVTARAVRLYDSSLMSSTLIAGPDSGTLRYGSAESVVIPFWGDSVLFLDLSSQAFVVLNAAGAITRTIALPTGTEGSELLTGQPAVDPRGRLYYRRPGRASHGGSDSSVIVRVDLETRSVDTLAYVVGARDEWNVLSDGTVAIVRGDDYHVDWIHPNGSRSSTSELLIEARPDSGPPVAIGTGRSDLRGNVWVPPMTSRARVNGGLMYDGISQNGSIARRLLLKRGYSVAAFGPGNTVYLLITDSMGQRLARARIGSAPLRH